MDKNTALVDVSSVPMVLTLEGRKYKLPPLSMGDIANTERDIVEQRFDMLLRKTHMPPLPDDVRAKAMAEVLGSAVLLNQILLSYGGRLRLLYHSMRRADPSITWQFVTDGMPAVPTNTLTMLMYKLAGLGPGSDEEADPTPATTPEHGEPPSDGTKNSPGSAAGST